MAKNRTTKSTFQSLYGEGFVTPAQYLTEALCFLVARQRGLNLGDRFWQDKEWAKFFRRQVTVANELLETYDVQAVLKALKDRRIKNKIKSLGAKFMLVPIIEEYQKEINFQKNKPVVETPKQDIHSRPAKRTGKRSSLSKLKDIDNEHG